MNTNKLFEMMASADYKERLKAEYLELHTRIKKLSAMLDRYRNGTLDFTPTCPYDLLHEQLVYMKNYMKILEERATLENVSVDE